MIPLQYLSMETKRRRKIVRVWVIERFAHRHVDDIPYIYQRDRLTKYMIADAKMWVPILDERRFALDGISFHSGKRRLLEQGPYTYKEVQKRRKECATKYGHYSRVREYTDKELEELNVSDSSLRDAPAGQLQRAAIEKLPVYG